MLTSFMNLPPLLMLAYIVLFIFIIGFIFVFIRYAYISFFYRNKFYYLGYKSGILGIRNFGSVVKDEIFKKDDKIDIKEKIKLIKFKLKELVIDREITVIEDNVQVLNKKIENMQDIRKDKFLSLEENTFDNVQTKILSLIGSSDIKELKKVIEDISGYIEDLKQSISSVDTTQIYKNLATQLDEYTNEYDERKKKILFEIQQLEGKIPPIEEFIGILQNKKAENENIESLMKQNKNGNKLALSIKEDFKNLGNGVGLIIIVVGLISLLIADILLMYKLIRDLSAREISEGKYFIEGFISYELFGIVVSLFLPIVLLVIMEVILRKAKAGKILGYVFKYGIIFLSTLSFFGGFGYFIWTRIVGGDASSIETIMPFFLLPATLALAYGFEAIANSKNGFAPVNAPLVIVPKSLIYSVYVSWKHLESSVRKRKQRNAIEKQLINAKEEKNILLADTLRNQGIIESLKEERDKKILGEVKEYINIEGSLHQIDKSLIGISAIENNAGVVLNFTDSIIKAFKETFENIRKDRKNERIKTEKKIQLLKKNIEDIEQGFEYAIKEKLTFL